MSIRRLEPDILRKSILLSILIQYSAGFILLAGHFSVENEPQEKKAKVSTRRQKGKRGRVYLDEFFGVALGDALEHVGTEAGAGAAGDRVAHGEALEVLGALGLAVDDVEDLVEEALAVGVARRPVVAGAAAVLRLVDVLGVVQFGVRRVHDRVDDAATQKENIFF